MIERCQECRFWKPAKETFDPNDPGHGWGKCRRHPPVVSAPLIDAQIERPRYGEQVDLELTVIEVFHASLYPSTFSTGWCGEYSAPAPAVPL